MRTLPTDFATALAGTSNRPRYLFAADFVGTSIHLWSGAKDLSWGGWTWEGGGLANEWDGGRDSDDLDGDGVTVKLAGGNADLIALVLAYSQMSAAGAIWLAYVDENEDLLDDPVLVFGGAFDNATITDDPELPSLELKFEPEYSRLDGSVELRYNKESQRIAYPADLGFDYVPSLVDGFDGYWGKVKKKTPTKKGHKNKGNRK